MLIASFEELCKGFCDIAGFTPPTLQSAGDGRFAFSVRMRGVYVSVVQSDQAGEPRALLIAEFGALQSVTPHTAWLALMDANLLMMDVDAPRFCRHPRDGRVLLQWSCPLSDLSSAELYRRVALMTDTALQWRQDCLMSSHDPASTPMLSRIQTPLSLHDVMVAGAIIDFRGLHQQLCRTLHQQVHALEEAVMGDCSFPLQLSALQTEVRVSHLPSAKPGMVFVTIPFTAPAAHGVLSRVTALMDANFVLAQQEQSATFCRDPWSGELLLAYACSLDGIDAQRFLAQAKAFASLARRWQPESQEMTV